MTSQKVYILRYLILLLPVIGILWACTDDGVIDPSHGHDLGDRDGDLVRKAKLRADGLRDFFSLPDLSRTYGKVQTRSGGMSSYTLRGGDFTLDWDRVHRFVEENGDEVLIVPINLTSGVAIRRFSIIGNKRRVEQTPMRSFYYVKKHGATNRLVCRILSYAPSRNYLKKHKDEAGIEWYNPQGTDYSGLFLVSSLNGTIMHGVNYEKGHRKYFFRPNIPKDAKTVTRSVVADSCHHEHSNELIELAASDIYFSMRMITSTSSVSAYSYDDETYDGGCLFCGKTVENCECNFVVGGEEEEEDDDTYNDAYCPICNFDECTCLQFCDVCGQSIYMCTCNLDGDDAGGTAFPGGGGGGSTSPPTVTGGTAEQRAIIQSIVNDLVSVYYLNMNGINIQVINQCFVLAQISDGYTGIEVCNEFFTFPKEDQTSILWHEMFHYNNDDKSWKDLGDYIIDAYTVTPPADIDMSIKYLIEKVDGIPRQLYDNDSGEYIDNSAWDCMYYYRTLINDFKNPIYTENEINAYEAEINKFTNVSERYRHERIHTLWMHKERMKKFKELGL